jgi:UDP-N-acetylmuramate--alanine ligase
MMMRYIRLSIKFQTEVICSILIHLKGINDFSFALPGRHNLNALMAIAMAVNFGTNRCHCSSLSFIQRSSRRFSYQIKTQNLVYIDDYAHHPTEINAVHQAVRELYQKR